MMILKVKLKRNYIHSFPNPSQKNPILWVQIKVRDYSIHTFLLYLGKLLFYYCIPKLLGLLDQKLNLKRDEQTFMEPK